MSSALPSEACSVIDFAANGAEPGRQVAAAERGAITGAFVKPSMYAPSQYVGSSSDTPT